MNDQHAIDQINTWIHQAVAVYGSDPALAKELGERILALMPTHPYALNLLGVLAIDAQDFTRANQLFEQLLQAHPDSEQGKSNYEICKVRQHMLADQLMQEAMTHYYARHISQAIEVYERAIAHGVDNAQMHSNLGAHWQELGNWGKSKTHYERALALDPNNMAALYNLGHLLSLQHRLVTSEPLLRRALALNEGYTDAHIVLGHVMVQLGNLEDAMPHFDIARQQTPQSILPITAKLFNYAFDARTTAADMYELASLAASNLEQCVGLEAPSPLACEGVASSNSSNPSNASKHLARAESKVIKLGFVSGDLKEHPVGYFLENLLRHANREQFEWHIFSNFEASDAVAARIKTLATCWTSIAQCTDEVAKSLITDKGIDVLFDLSGYTALHRLGVFAMRAAPIQVTWLGWHDTTGLREMDYLLTDAASIPPMRQANGKPYLSEEPLLLPSTRLCMMPPQNAPGIAPLPAHKNGYVTFGSMQILAKLSPVSLTLWASILRQAPTARLIIRTKQFLETPVARMFEERLRTFDMPLERVQLLPPLSRDDYLAAFADIDILLDSHPYPGGTTTAEALWMGVPTLTLGGQTMISCQGVSLLTAAGLPDWIASSREDYVAKAVQWTQQLEQLSALRQGLREQVANTALFNGEHFARDFENVVKEQLKAGRTKGSGHIK